MDRISYVSILFLAFLALNCEVAATTPRIRIHVPTDTVLYLGKVAKTRASDLMHRWTMKGVDRFYASIGRVIQDEKGIHQTKDTIIILSLRYSPPRSYSPMKIQYSLIMSFMFIDSICINDDSLSDLSSNLESLIRDTESSKGGALFLQNIHADSGRISFSDNARSFEWYTQDDSLKSSYGSWAAKVFVDDKRYIDSPRFEFAFHNPTLLENLNLYLGRWKLPQVEQFRKNSKIRYARLYGGSIRMSSGTSCSGNHEYFVESISRATIASFRLNHTKDWSTFTEFYLAQLFAKRFLKSLPHSDCEVSTSSETSFTVLPSLGNRGCEACGNVIYVSVSCAGLSQPMAVSVELLNDYNVGEVRFANPEVLK